jgi:hypothetical protein
LLPARSDDPTPAPPAPSDPTAPRLSQRLSGFWDLHAIRFIVGGGVALGLLAGLVLWHRDAASGGGGIGSFLFDVVLIGLVLCAPLAILALVLTDRAVAFLGGVFVILVGNVLYRVSQRRNGPAAAAGDAEARARVDRWKKWQKEWTR